jgi:hypothetical protein
MRLPSFEDLDSTSTATAVHGAAIVAMLKPKICSKADINVGRPQWSMKSPARRQL